MAAWWNMTNTQRSLGYYLVSLLMLAPLMKHPLKAVLKGVTNMDSSFSRLWADPGGRDLFLSAEQLSTPLGQGDPVLSEDLRRNWAKLLLEKIYKDPIMRNRWLEFVGPQCCGGPPSQHHLIRLPVAVVGEMSRWQHNMQHSEDLHQYHADLTSL